MLAAILFTIAAATEPLEVEEDTVIDGVPVQRGPVQLDEDGEIQEATLGATIWVGGLQLEAGTHWVRSQPDVWTVSNAEGIRAWNVHLKGPVQVVWHDDVPVRVQGEIARDVVVDEQSLRAGHVVVFKCMDTGCVHMSVDLPNASATPTGPRRVQAPGPAAAKER